MNIIDLELSIRSSNAIRREGIETVDDLIKLTIREFKTIPGLGPKSLLEIAWTLAQLPTGEFIIKQEEEKEILSKSRAFDRIKQITDEASKNDTKRNAHRGSDNQTSC